MFFKKKRKEPNEESCDFVGECIDLIHDLDWPEEYGSEDYIDFFKNLPDKQRKMWATWIYQMEVENGGHSQYFFNLQDESYLAFCLDGLNDMKAGKIFSILDKALRLAKNHVDELNTSKKWEDWIDVLDQYNLRKKLWKLDEKFFDLKADFYDLRKSYIQQNINDFRDLIEK